MKKAARTRSTRVAPLVKTVLICLFTYILLFVMLYVGITPEQYSIQVGSPAPTQIKATKDIMDIVTTEANRDRAAHAVEPSYRSTDPTVLNSVLLNLSSQLDAMRTLRNQYTAEAARALTDEELAQIVEETSLAITRDQIAILIETNDTTINSLFTAANKAVRETLVSVLPEGQENNALKSISADLSSRYSRQLTDIVVNAIGSCLRPNMLIDEEITAANREKAREDVPIVWYVKDQVIVGEGQIVTEAHYTMIDALGILDENTVDLKTLLGIAVLILLVEVSLGFYLYQFNRAMLSDPKQVMLLSLIVLLVVGLSLGFRFIHPYLMPVSLGLLLVVLLMDSRLALFINLTLTLLISILAPAGSGLFALSLMTAICGPVIVTLFAHRSLRTTMLVAGVIIGAVNFLITLSVGLVNSAEIYDVFTNAGISALSGIISAVLCVGIQPLLEWMFNLATSTKLIELSNPNQPLLRRLLLEASGTYHHSIIVANLAEAACSAVGANGLLARVGAYYHDIGKLKRPMYFKENQMGDNPHDRTDPRVSTAILTAHTRDGAQLAQKARIPEPVIDIIRQHHGDTPVMYFYDKAQKLYGDQADISAFRYEGPRPRSREAAIVMLADTIEAATRALPNPDPEKIDALIRKLVRGKLSDGQLDSSTLTFNDIDKICGAFSTVLTGVFHERIEYPDVVIPPRIDRAEAIVEVTSPAISIEAASQADQLTSKPAERPAIPAPKSAVQAENARPAAQSAKVAPASNEQNRQAAKPACEQPRAVAAPSQSASPVQESASAAQATKPSCANEQSRTVVTPGQPVAPVQPSKAPCQNEQPRAAAEPVQSAKPACEQPRIIVTPGQPVPPVQTPKPACVSEQPRAVVTPGQPVPPVQTPKPACVSEQPRVVVTPGQPVPPVQTTKPACTAEQPQTPATAEQEPPKGESDNGD